MLRPIVVLQVPSPLITLRPISLLSSSSKSILSALASVATHYLVYVLTSYYLLHHLCGSEGELLATWSDPTPERIFNRLREVT